MERTVNSLVNEGRKVSWSPGLSVGLAWWLNRDTEGCIVESDPEELRQTGRIKGLRQGTEKAHKIVAPAPLL